MLRARAAPSAPVTDALTVSCCRARTFRSEARRSLTRTLPVPWAPTVSVAVASTTRPRRTRTCTTDPGAAPDTRTTIPRRSAARRSVDTASSWGAGRAPVPGRAGSESTGFGEPDGAGVGVGVGVGVGAGDAVGVGLGLGATDVGASIHNSLPTAGLVALNSSRSPSTAALFGVPLWPPGNTSAASTVPPLVPSVVHTSRPVVRVVAEK